VTFTAAQARKYLAVRGFGSLCVSLILAAAVVAAGCAAHTVPSAPAPTVSPDQTGPAALVGEVRRELTAMRSSRYQHTTHVDEAAGSFDYDCSGMLDYALQRALPGPAAALPIDAGTRPPAADIEHYLHRGLAGQINGWQTLGRVDELSAGDVVAWLATEDSKTGDTGHVMVVLARPRPNPARAEEWLVNVADSTLRPHAADSRHAVQTGLGTGTIGLVADQQVVPIAFYWQGGVSKSSKATEIALGRPT